MSLGNHRYREDNTAGSPAPCPRCDSPEVRASQVMPWSAVASCAMCGFTLVSVDKARLVKRWNDDEFRRDVFSIISLRRGAMSGVECKQEVV